MSSAAAKSREVVAPKGRLGVVSVEARTVTLPFRLPPAHESDLRVAFTELETNAGMRTRYWQDFERMMGVVADSAGSSFGSRESDEEDVHLFDLERHCDRVGVWSERGRAARIAKCRAALVAMGTTALGRAQVIFLHLVYGHPDPNAPYQHWGRELAPLARHTAAVEAQRQAMVTAYATDATGRTAAAAVGREDARRLALSLNAKERAEVESRIDAIECRVARLVHTISRLRARFESAPRTMADRRPIAKRVRHARKSQQRAILSVLRARETLNALAAEVPHLERWLAQSRPTLAAADQSAHEIVVGADNAVTAWDALHAGLAVSFEPREHETAADRKTRRKAAEAVRDDFVRLVAKQAARLLADASTAYLAARVPLR